MNRDNENRIRIRCAARLLAPAGAVFLCLLAVIVPATAEPADEAGDPTPQPVFQAIEDAWNAEDAGALAALVQIDGLRVTLEGGGDRVTEYGRSQSLYYFQDLLRSRETLDFRFVRTQDVTEGRRAHGMAAWSFRTPKSTDEQELRLVFLLTRPDDVWRLSEINKITVR